MTPAQHVATRQHLLEGVLRLADSPLILAQQLGALVAHLPTMEEDVAAANVALDLLGQARALLSYAGKLEGRGRDEDDLAFTRHPHEFHSVLLVEQPDTDFAHTLLRQFLYDAYAIELWTALHSSSDSTLAAIAAKATKETRYHVRRSAEWVVRLGDGTDESARRLAAALESLWMFAGELFLDDPVDAGLAEAGVAPLPSSLEPAWRTRVEAIFEQARLVIPKATWPQRGGKQGRHTEHLGYLLAEMQALPRAYPGARW
jgi:ring-1,2-phenylacetyl-CoA epoxidase subunit PaaC